jgi:transposase
VKEALLARNTTPTFIQSFELKPTAQGNKLGSFKDLDLMSEHYRKSYNATLGRFYVIAQKMKASPAWSDTRKLKSKTKKKAEFEKIKKDFGYTQKAFEDFVKSIRSNEQFFRHTHSAVMQASVAKRAMAAIDKYIYARAKRVGFKRYGDNFSFEGKQNSTGIRLFHNQKSALICTVQGLDFNILFDQTNPYHIHAFHSRVKFSRVIRKTINGRVRYFVQGAFEGFPYNDKRKSFKYRAKLDQKSEDNLVGLDFGPSHLYLVDTDGEAKTFRLSKDVEQKTKEIKTLQRKLDRQRRAANPGNYNKDGTIKKGPKKWINTKGYLRTRKKLANLERKKVASRRSSHGEIANEILAHSSKIKTENINYKSWQKMFGKSIKQHAPSALEGELTRKASYARGWCHKINTRQTALSQTCLCGVKKKKTLSQRIHDCDRCGFKAPRDYVSAYLAIFCHETKMRKGSKWTVDLGQARKLLQGEWYFTPGDARHDACQNFKTKGLADGSGGIAPAEKLVRNLLADDENFLMEEESAV